MISRITRIQGAVQHYEWGGYEYIPSLLGIDNSARRPYAELWLGAHPSAPATADGRPLNLICELPYLLKVLDARAMLSIQAHPSRAQAEEGYAREEAAGAHLNYRDRNHKPEVHVALTEFWMLHGFRPWAEVAAIRALVPEAQSMRELYGTLMTMPQVRVAGILQPWMAGLERESPADPSTPDYWALRAAREYPNDRGIFSIYLLNLVHLRPGQGTYQPAGVLHAYLHGTNVELMANSDNVLRGGLTPKHVDVAELMLTLSFAEGAPRVLEGEQLGSERVYRTTAGEFELSRIGGEFAATSRGPDTLLAIDGNAQVLGGGEQVKLRRGQAVLIPTSMQYSVSDGATIYRATLPRP